MYQFWKTRLNIILLCYFHCDWVTSTNIHTSTARFGILIELDCAVVILIVCFCVVQIDPILGPDPPLIIALKLRNCLRFYNCNLKHAACVIIVIAFTGTSICGSFSANSSLLNRTQKGRINRSNFSR